MIDYALLLDNARQNEYTFCVVILCVERGLFMNLFDINYLSKISELFGEAFKLKKYKVMPVILAVLAFILMFPILFASFLVALILFVFAFVFETNISLVKSLHNILSNEASTAHPAAQFVLYWVSWPLVFSLYITEGLLLCVMVPLYAILSVLVYIWSFGGIKFHLFARKNDDISIEVPKQYKLIPALFVAIGCSFLVLIPLLHGIFHLIDLYYDYNEKMFIYDFTREIYPRYFRMYLSFITWFPLVCAHNLEKEKKN